MQPAVRLLCAAALSLASASAFTATSITDTPAAFLAQVAPGYYTESFDGLASPPSGPVAFAAGGFAYTASAPGDIYLGGDFLGAAMDDVALTIDFTSGNVTALGANFFASDFFDGFQAASITLTLGDGTVEVFTPASAADSFRGFVSDVAITTLVVRAPAFLSTGFGDVVLYAGLDNLTVGVATVVPEPTSGVLMALGLAGLLLARRRRT